MHINIYPLIFRLRVICHTMLDFNAARAAFIFTGSTLFLGVQTMGGYIKIFFLYRIYKVQTFKIV